MIEESKDKDLKEWRLKEAFEWRSKESFSICRVDTEGLSSEDISLLEGAKGFSKLREVESVESLAAEVKTLYKFSFSLLEEVVTSSLRKE